MKNITRRGFLQLTAATALVCAAAPLTGCRKKNIKKLVLGDWYMEGYSRLEYAIYDDGSCQVRSGYGLGKWSIVNDDKLRISDFYGQTLIYKIEKISKKSMTLRLIWDGKESETADTFYHTAEEAEKHKNERYFADGLCDSYRLWYRKFDTSRKEDYRKAHNRRLVSAVVG